MRIKRGVTKKRRHKKVISQAKGYRWGRSKLYDLAKSAVSKAGQHAYVGRKKKKVEYRQLWIVRISAALRTLGKNYSRFQNALTTKKITLNRKMLSEIAVRNPEVFEKIVKEVSN